MAEMVRQAHRGWFDCAHHKLGLIGFVFSFSKAVNYLHNHLFYNKLISFLVFRKLALFCIILFILIDLSAVNRQSPLPKFQPQRKKRKVNYKQY